MTLSTRFISVFLGFGLLMSAIQPVSAEVTSPLHTGQHCTSQIQLPQDKEDLELNDVKQAVVSHLLRIGAVKHEVLVSWIDEDTIAADIIHFGKLRRQIKVDAANATIIERMDYRKPVGFKKATLRTSLALNNSIVKKARYARQLRRHMLGDGKAWAEWVNADAKGISCRDDYRFGGPIMPEPSS
jgi:hypothetical protein